MGFFECGERLVLDKKKGNEGIKKMNIDKSVNIKKMKKEIKELEKHGLKKGIDFDVIVKEEGETDEEGMNKLLNNRFIKEDLIEIGNVGTKRK